MRLSEYSDIEIIEEIRQRKIPLQVIAPRTWSASPQIKIGGVVFDLK